MSRIWNRRIAAMLAVVLLTGCGAGSTTTQPPEQSASIIREEQTEIPEAANAPDRVQTVPEQTVTLEPQAENAVDSSSAPEQSEEVPAPDAITSSTPENTPQPVEPEQASITDTAYTCAISISCASILENLDALAPEKAGLVPEDGWILKPTVVTFYEGESVFDLLQRICKQEKIHLEFEDTPLYNSAYIEGIHNLYEFDCGNLSGWMYQVNGWFPNYGCSGYQLQDGDVVCWEYTCDLGADVNGGSSAIQQG